MAQDPAFLMYYDKWLTSTRGWDADVRGWYFDLLCHQADKPEGLPDDIETLAQLAGVKFKEFERFKGVWERTLEAKFMKNDQGLLINLKQQQVILDRRDYIEKQSLRGRIGYFIKIARTKHKLPEEYIPELAKQLESEKINEKDKENSRLCFERTLEALMINKDLNINSIKEVEKNGSNKKFGNNGLSRQSILLKGIAQTNKAD